jgi:uncharacterized membrane protein YfcA
MDIYLPIADMAVDVFLILSLGALVGFLSGLFGIGGGFLTTPLLIFIGIPPAVAVATGANQIVAPSVSAVLAHWRRGNVDLKMGLALLAGGIVGSVAGVGVFALLHKLAQLDVVVRIAYVLFLGVIGLLMLQESVQAMLRSRTPAVKPRGRRTWMDALPLKMRFRRSRLYISVLLPIAVGLLVGVLAAIMGVGGGFIMVPAMIYLLGMPSTVVVGTSLFQIIFVTATVTVLQAILRYPFAIFIRSASLRASPVPPFTRMCGGKKEVVCRMETILSSLSTPPSAIAFRKDWASPA